MLCVVQASKRLRAYLDDAGLSAAEFARRCNTTRQWVSRIKLGHAVPGRALAVTIEKHTADAKGGPIRVEEWT